jgi:transposase-like protein
MSIVPPRKRRSYTAEFKVEAAHRVIDSDRTIAEVARELGIDAGMLSVWVKDERRRIAAAEVHGEKPLETAERAELLRLRRQVAELEKDNQFLVKASAYFAAMQKNRPGSI